MTMEADESATSQAPVPGPLPSAERGPTAEAILEHMPLVHRIAAQFMRKLPKSVQREDLIAAGTVGLFHALRSSAHTCPEMFSSYARIRIRGSIVDELRRHDWSPRRRKDPAAAAAARGYANDAPAAAPPSRRGLLRAVTDPPPATTAGTNPAPAASIPQRAPAVSVVGFDDLPPHGAEIAGELASPLDDVLQRREHEALHAAVASLPARERDIVHMRYFQGMPSKAIAQALGLSEARVSQLHARATSRLRDFLAETGSSRRPSEVKLAA